MISFKNFLRRILDLCLPETEKRYQFEPDPVANVPAPHRHDPGEDHSWNDVTEIVRVNSCVKISAEASTPDVQQMLCPLRPDRMQQHRMNQPFFLFAHGAGAPSTHPWMVHWAGLLNSIGAVETFDYAYIAERRKYPDRLPALIAAHRSALEAARQRHGGSAILIGKSMGSRVGCHVALEEKVNAIVCFGYPLCGAGDRTKLRDQVLRDLRTPIFFMQGTRDSLCPLDLLANVRREMTVENELHVVEGGDHSLLLGKTQLKASGITQEDVDRKLLKRIEQFVAKHTLEA